MYHADLVGGLVLPGLRTRHGFPALVWNIRQSDLDPRLTRRTTRIVARINAWVSRFAPRHVVCCSQRALEIHRDLGYRPPSMSVIPNGFDLERFRPDPAARAALRDQLAVAPDAPLVGLVARFDPQKDVQTFLNAVARVRRERSELKALLCGPGMDLANPILAGWVAQADADAPGLRDALRVLGPRTDTPGVLAALDLLVSSSAYGEGFPNVVGEAMACGVPCLVTDVGDSGLIVAGTGRCVPPREPVALAEGVLDLLRRGPDGLAALGQAARDRVAAHYAISRIAERYASLYRSLNEGTR
jgi:glycosyltransferase involved in cell wall biosynthesis